MTCTSLVEILNMSLKECRQKKENREEAGVVAMLMEKAGLIGMDVIFVTKKALRM